MWRREPRAGSGSPGCPDLLLHVQTLRSPPSPLYLSFFEEECRAIAARLRLGAESSPGPGELSALYPEAARPVTSTPLPVPSHGRLPESGVGDCEASAGPGPGSAPEPSVGDCEVPAAPGSAPELSVGDCEAPAAPGSAPELSVGGCEAPAAPGPGEARREPGCVPQPAAGGGSGARLARPCAPSRRVRPGAGQPSGGRPSSPACSSGRGRTRLSLARTRASLGLQLPAVGTGRGAWETRLLQPPGTRLKRPSPARSRLQNVSGASQQAQPSTRPKPVPRDREVKSNSAPASCLTRSRKASAVKAGSRKQPSSRLSTAIPTLTSRSSLRPPGKAASSKLFCLSEGSTTQELVCNRTQELKENGERKERLIAAGTVLGAGKANQTWVCEESSLSSELAPGLTSRCEDAVPAEQSAGDQLSQELDRVKKELERVKGELADKTAQCEAYQQTISSLQAQLRAAGICLKDAAVFDSDDLGRD